MAKENYPFSVSVGDSLCFGVKEVSFGVQFGIHLPNGKKRYLKLFKKGHDEPAMIIPLTDRYKKGSSYFVVINKKKTSKDKRSIAAILTKDYEYLYEVDGKEFIDRYADCITGREIWGKRDEYIRGGICLENFDWEEDSPLLIPYKDLILYQLHVRGYTKHRSSKVTNKGYFQGLVEKIPYIKELGINGVLLMPVYEFDEVISQNENLVSFNGKKDTEKINYWGYGTKNTFYFAPKGAYTAKKVSPFSAFCEMVKEFHKNGIEVILDIYFTPGTNLFMMTDCLRSWVLKYHVDGFRVNQEVMPSLSLASDPILSGVKILGEYWDMNLLNGAMLPNQKNALAEYNEGYMNDVRKFLKGDEGMVERISRSFTRNSMEHSYINFVTHVNGFSLLDLVSYDIKHNDANGEMNHDGTEFNFSWNCGFEGKTRKKVIIQRRMTQIRNALLMLFTSQSTPMLLAGDEFLNTQSGNNNPYCQDNEITWLNWNETKGSREILEYVKKLIKFRKCFQVLHQEEPLKYMDTMSVGIPDVSVHGTQTWRPDFSNYSRMLAMLYFGDYVSKEDGRSVYIIYNMFWEEKNFDLPILPGGRVWKKIIDTYNDEFEENLIYPKRSKIKRKNKSRTEYLKKTMVQPRSIVIFVEE